MAFADARFANSLLRAVNGEEVVECSFVKSDAVDGVDYFSTPLALDVRFFCRRILMPLQKHGVKKVLGTGKLSPFEQKLIGDAIPELQDNIARGIAFMKG